MLTPAALAESKHMAKYGSNACLSGVMEARSSFAMSLVPMTMTDIRSWCAI